MPHAQTPVRTRFRLEDGRPRSRTTEEARVLLRGEVPGHAPGNGPPTAEQVLDALFPEDGDESLISYLLEPDDDGPLLTFLLPPGASPISEVLSPQDLVQRVHEEANRRGELWNPVLDRLAGNEYLHSFLLRKTHFDDPELLSVSGNSHLPKDLMAGISQSELDALISQPRLGSFLSPMGPPRDPVVKEAAHRGAPYLSGYETLAATHSGGTRAILLAPYLEALSDPDELNHLLDAFHSDAFRTMAALTTPIISRTAALKLVRTPKALGALMHNPEARDPLIRDGTLASLVRWAVRPGVPDQDSVTRSADLKVRDAVIRSVTALFGQGAPPFPTNLGRHLRRERNQSLHARDSPLRDEDLEALLVADPANTADDLLDFVTGGRHRSRLDVLCHPSATPEVARAAFEHPAGSTDSGTNDRIQALRSSPLWRAAPEEARDDPEETQRWRAGFLRDLLDRQSLEPDELAAIAGSEDAGPDIWNALLDQHSPHTTAGVLIARSLVCRDDVLATPGLVVRLVTEHWLDDSDFDLVFGARDPETWSEVARELVQHQEGFWALSRWLSESNLPPEGARLPDGTIPRMLASNHPRDRETAVWLVGKGFGGEDARAQDDASLAGPRAAKPPSPRPGPSR